MNYKTLKERIKKDVFEDLKDEDFLDDDDINDILIKIFSIIKEEQEKEK